jgi:IS605 OrfB family transposase
VQRKAFQFRLYPKKEQEQKWSWTLSRCRELYNAGLSERRESYKYTGKGVSSYEQKRDLVEIKQIREEYQDIASHVLQDVMTRLEKAFQNFFRRVKHGEKPGYPRFQGGNRYDSFTYPDGAGWKLTTRKRPPEKKGMVRVNLNLSKIGIVKLHLHRDIVGTIKTLTIKREGEHWYAVVSCEIEKPETVPVSYEDVGIDLGVTHFAALSNGEFLENPRQYRRAEKKLKKLQASLSRKKRGSHRRKKAVQAVAKAHRKVRNQRTDFAHKASRQLVNRYQVLVFEDLQVTNLVKRPKPKQDEETGQYLPNGAAAKSGLNKSITDAGWSQFVGMCTYKAVWAGRTLLKVSPKYTSQICPHCGAVRKKTLEERWHSCACGCELDRDTASAKVILDVGQQALLGGTRPTSVTA